MFLEEQLMNVVSTQQPNAEKLVSEEKRENHSEEHESHEDETSTSVV